ncbi:MAG TPA: signal peptidase II [Polyangiaceae bacterium]|nr:signal peptidase II [Polyangiaceae bacterium]
MNKKPVPGSWSRLALFGTMALAGSGCDLKTKAWAEQVLPAHPEGTLSVVEPWVELTLAYNHGTAFSVVPNMGSGTFLFGVFALILAAGLLATILFTRVGRLEALALGTIAGGGIGNGIERLAGTGVVDFIKVNYPWGGSWPLFNVADVLIVVGVALLFLLPKNKKKREASGAPAS